MKKAYLASNFGQCSNIVINVVQETNLYDALPRQKTALAAALGTSSKKSIIGLSYSSTKSTTLLCCVSARACICHSNCLVLEEPSGSVKPYSFACACKASVMYCSRPTQSYYPTVFLIPADFVLTQ